MSETTLDGVLRRSDDGHAVRFERAYPTDIHDLWSALTEPDRVARWLAEVTGDLRVGGRVTVHFDDGPAAFEVVTCECPHTLAARWLSDAGGSLVTARLASTNDGRTQLVLDHTGLRASSAPGYAAGWHYYLDALGPSLAGEPAPSWDSTFPALLAGYRERVSPPA